MPSTATIAPNLGLYIGQSDLTIPSRALADGIGFRIHGKKLSNLNLGWNPWIAEQLDGPVTLIETFKIRGGDQSQIYGTTTSLYRVDGSDNLQFINPIYATGTIEAAADVATGDGTDFVTAGIKIGDFISVGANDETSPSATWYPITAVTDATHLTATGLGTVAAMTPYTIRRVFTGNLVDYWRTEVFVLPDDGTGDDLIFFTNGVDSILTWDGLADQVVERSGDLGFTCKELTVYKNMMIYGNLVYDSEFLPTTIINSDVGKPLAAGDAGTGLSEQFRVHDGTEAIKIMEDLGDNLVVYADRKIVLMQFVGDPLIFVLREAASGVGPLTGRLLADFGDYHEFIGADSQYLFDGVSVTEVGKQVWREVLRLRDPARHDLGFAHFDEENGDLIWVIPLTSDDGVGDDEMPAERAYVEHYLEDVGDRTPTPFSLRYAPWTCGGYSTITAGLTWDNVVGTWEELSQRWNESNLFAAFPVNLMGSLEGDIFKINDGLEGNGTPLLSFVRFGRRLLGDSRIRGLLARIYPFSSQLPGPLEVYTRYMDHAQGPATITQTDSFDSTLPEGGHFVTPYRRGRFYDVGFGSSVGLGWEIAGFDQDARSGGRR